MLCSCGGAAKPRILRLNFVRYNAGAKPGARLDIPLRPINSDRCPALKEGGWLFFSMHRLPVFAWGDKVPDHLQVDLRGLRAGDRISASEVELPEGLRVRHPGGRRMAHQDFAVAKLQAGRRGGGS